MSSEFQLNIVSAEKALFSGTVRRVKASGVMGEMEINPGHAPLLSPLKTGSIQAMVVNDDGVTEEQLYYISSGIMEVQPYLVTILADTSIRATDLDEAEVLKAEKEARTRLSQSKSEIDYTATLAQLAQASAQLELIKKLRRK